MSSRKSSGESASKRREWFEKARFGMFIHYALFSITARGGWEMYTEKWSVEEYARLADKLRPKRFDPNLWAALAKEAGMKYMVFGSRHHDGFSLFDSKVSDFTSVKTAARCDFVGEYVKACRKAGLKVGIYYSLPDWRFPAFMAGPEKDPKGWDAFVDYVHAQVRELCTQYGKIDILWYDDCMGPHTPEMWRAKKLNAMVRRLQPHILINNRSGLPEDFDTPEQEIGSPTPGRMWETCMTIGDQWGYNPQDRNLKSPWVLLKNLSACVAGGGNFLLNAAPKGDGSIPTPQVVRLRQMGAWLRRNGASIYGAGPAPFGGAQFGSTTAKGDTVYMHCHYWHGRQIRCPNVKDKVVRAWILATGEKVRFEQKGDLLMLLDLPVKSPEKPYTVIALKLQRR